MKITFKGVGPFNKTVNYLNKLKDMDLKDMFVRYGDIGVIALEESTPERSGLTSGSWKYRLEKKRNGYALIWYNTNMAGVTPLVLLIQYGHATRGGTYVQGIDFINPAMQPIFDMISDEITKEVTSL